MARQAQTQKSSVQIGPLTGGLNNVSKAGESRDTEVIDMVNLEVTLDQALTSRPAIETVTSSTLPSTNTITWDVLGIYRVDSNEWYLIVSVPKDGTTNVNTTVRAYLNGIIGAGETILVVKESLGINNRVSSMVQFKDRLYFNTPFSATDTGFHWKKGDAIGGTPIASMPHGNVMISWKTRIWISGTGESTIGDRVRFSKIDGTGPHPDTYDAADFFDVEPGSGGFITAIIPSFNNLIIFKDDGTWRFTYASNPADGQVDKISGSVGCASKNAVCDFENYLYVYDQGRVYELVNSGFTQVNRFVEFDEDDMGVDSSAPDVEMSIVSRRLVVRYYNAIYSFNVDTKTWSKWRSYNGTPGKWIELPASSASASPSTFIAASRGLQQSVSPNMVNDPSFAVEAVRTARSASVGATITYASDIATLLSTGPAADMLLNTTGDTTEYDFIVAAQQQFDCTFEVTAITGTATAVVTYLKKDGSTTTSSSTNITTTGLKSFSFTAPTDALLANLRIHITAAGSVSYKDPNFNRKTAVAPLNLLRIKDEYPSQTNYVEYIECYFQTKSYDYKTPGNFKRLYWAGLDIKTTQKVYTECRPVSRAQSILWDDLEDYTHDELEAGTWENPLSWLSVSFAVFNILDADDVISENGRYFKKIGEAMRFRQISYRIKTSTFGNSETGPVKFFSLTTFIGVKQEVVDSST